MTTARDITIYQGQAFALSLDYAGTAGRGQRMHIRLADSTATVVQILTHNGDANARVLFDGDAALDVTIGASVSAGWVVLADRVEWVYDIEDYDLADEDDCVIPYRGKVIARGNRTRASDVTPSDQMPSGDGRYTRFDGEQNLTPEQMAQAQINILGEEYSPGAGSGDVVGPAGATDSRISEFDGTTGKLIKQSSYTIASLIAYVVARAQHTGTQLAATISDFAATASAAAPVQSVAGRTGAVTLAVGDVSGAEASANKAQANGYASLDSGGKIPQAQLPAIAITEYLGDAANQAAMLALSGQKGDWCTRADSGAVWIITGSDPTLLGSWTSLTYPASPVTSVAGRTGAVTLSTSDISGLGTAAGSAASDFATAAQGSTADTAVQPARSVATQHSLTGGGDLSADRTLSLVNDSASPGNSKIYGTDGSGVRGWYDAPSGGTPAGSGSELQYRNAGAFGAASGTHWDATNGRLSIGAGTSPAAVAHIACDSASEIPLIAQGAASQTAALHEWRSSTGTVLLYISSAGILTNGNATLSLGTGGAGASTLKTGGDLALHSDNGTSNGVLLGINQGGLRLRGVAATIYAADGIGTNGAGTPVLLSGGRSTGSATPAPLKLRGTAAGSSGSTAQTLVDVLTITNANTVTLSDAVDVAVGTTTGTKFGTANTQKLGFWNATPVVQQAPVADATDATSVIAQLNELLAKLRTIGIIAT